MRKELGKPWKQSDRYVLSLPGSTHATIAIALTIDSGAIFP